MTPTPWKWVAEDQSMLSLNSEHNPDSMVLACRRCPSCQEADVAKMRCFWPEKEDADFIENASAAHAAAIEYGWGYMKKRGGSGFIVLDTDGGFLWHPKADDWFIGEDPVRAVANAYRWWKEHVCQ